MKRLLITLTFVLVGLCSTYSQEQLNKMDSDVTLIHGPYIEALGPGGYYSLNYGLRSVFLGRISINYSIGGCIAWGSDLTGSLRVKRKTHYECMLNRLALGYVIKRYQLEVGLDVITYRTTHYYHIYRWQFNEWWDVYNGTFEKADIYYPFIAADYRFDNGLSIGVSAFFSWKKLTEGFENNRNDGLQASFNQMLFSQYKNLDTYTKKDFFVWPGIKVGYTFQHKLGKKSKGL